MVRTFICMIAAAIMLSGCSFLDNFKAERRVKTLVHDALEVVEDEGADAFPRFTSSPWLDGEFYVFVFRTDGVMIFNPITPEDQGKNRIDIKDAKGVPVVANMLKIIEGRGRGWTEYYWHNPATGNDEPKRAYVASGEMAGEKIFVGSGYYRK